jgi:outer membrane protein OmpA-like peptidoglycan-associated protein
MTTLRPLPIRFLPVLALAAAGGLAGCVTHTAQPMLSRAVVDARAHRDVDKVATCGPLTSPVSVGFAFGENQLNDLAAPALGQAGQDLACHPEAVALVVGQADGHGTEAEQHQLAQARVNAVVKDLETRGVAPARIQTQVEGKPPAGDARRLVVLAEGRRW